jgi:predicted CoA-binding protein
MVAKQAIDRFLEERVLAVVGVSRSGKKFGNAIFKDLMARGYTVYPVNPRADVVEGERCYPSLRELPRRPGGVVVVVPPNQTEKVVRDAAAAGIRRIWMQQGAESQAAIRFCQEKGMEVVHGLCVMTFPQPVRFPCRVHRALLRLFGRLPR